MAQLLRDFTERVLRSQMLFVLLFIFLGYLFLSERVTAQTVSFGQAILQGENLNDPTTLSFGPNGALYVAQQDGTIWEFFIQRDDASPGNGSYSVSQQNIISLIKNSTPNHNDDGTLNNESKRQITGILATGTAETPVLYVTSSDSRIGGGPDRGDFFLDTNSGVISRLTWNGQQWEKVDLVRGLPRSEENHSTNGLVLYEGNNQKKLFVQSGGNTNMGAPSNNFAGAPETFLSGALLVIDLAQLETIEASNGGPFQDPRTGGTPYIYDLPTLNDPDRPDINKNDASFPYPVGHPLRDATIDLGDPFGGNNGLNQAFPESGGPVQVFSPGYRNAYDVLLTEDGRLFTSDNGPNATWGGPPVINDLNDIRKGDDSNTTYNPGAGDYVTNEFNITNGITHGDQLHYIGTVNDANGTYYAGHPAPIRAFPEKAGIIKYVDDNGAWVATNGGRLELADLLVGVSGYYNPTFSLANFPDDPRQGDYITDQTSNPNLNILDVVGSSTNGICEYTASNFENGMKGDILTVSYNGKISRYTLDAAGQNLIAKNNSFLSGFGSFPLDVIAQGDSDIFPGTIWAVSYGQNSVAVFEPVDFIDCLPPDDPNFDPLADYDNDQFTNQDEAENGTDPCSAGSQPTDFDGDKISDLNDPDDDNDGIPDLEDAFAWDPDNGLTTSVPLDLELFNNDPGTGFFGLGFTGLMLDPDFATNYLDQFDDANLSFGGAAGKATIDFTSSGDALGVANDQDNAFQVGVALDSDSPPFTIQSVIETPFNGTPPTGGQNYGIFLGTGAQSDYMKLVLSEGISAQDDVYGFDIVLEENDVVTFQQKFDVPGILEANGVTLYINVNTATQTATAFYSLNSGITIKPLEVAVDLPTTFLDNSDDQGLAVGIISTSGTGPSFTATWDNLIINQDQPGVLQVAPNTLNFGDVLINGSNAGKNLQVTNRGGANDPAIAITALNFTGGDASLFSSGVSLPLVISPGETVLLPVILDPDDVPRVLDTGLELIHNGANSPISLGIQGELVETINSTVIRINAGELTNQVAYDGNVYEQDQFFDNASTYSNVQANVPDLFKTERTDVSKVFSYNIPVPAGEYEVNLLFAEIFWNAQGGRAGGVGSRVFDIIIEGTLAFDNYDIIAKVGAETPTTETFNVTVNDGSLTIILDGTEAAGGSDQPKISAIEVISIANQKPNAVLTTSVESGEAPLTVNFSANESTDDDEIVSFFWDFGDGNTSNEVAPTYTYENAGIYEVTLTVTDSKGEIDTATAQIEVLPRDVTNGYELRVNAGGASVSFNGNLFSPDNYFNGGYNFQNSLALVDQLYQTERTASSLSFEYNIPVPDGNYVVYLHFTELFWGATGGKPGGVGSRIFDVSLEGDLILDNYDIIADVGPETQVIKSFPITIIDGEINLFFDASPEVGGVDQPKVSAIEIIGVDDSGITPIIVQNIDDQLSFVGEFVNLSVAASGGDPSQNLSYQIEGAPQGVQMEPTNGLISGTIAEGAEIGGASGDGVYQVTVTVSQSGVPSAEETFLWTVTAGNTSWVLKNEVENYSERSESSFVQVGDKFYLFGGRQNPTVVDVFDYTNNSWSQLSGTAPLDFNHVQAVAYEGMIWIIGGFQTNDFPDEVSLDHVWVFNPVTEIWYQGPEIPESRKRGSGGVVVFNDKIYLVGGNTQGHSGGFVPYFDEFDPATGTWTTLADAPRARDHFHAVVSNGKLYAMGGRLTGGTGGVFAPLVPEIDVYDFTTQTWSTLTSDKNIPTPRASSGTVSYNNEIHIMGGEVESLPTAYDITEIFDPVNEEWRSGPDMNFSRHGAQALVSGQGVYITGGSPNKGGGSQKNLEYLYTDLPEGNALVNSELNASEEEVFTFGQTKEIVLSAANGNVGVWINNIEIQGANAGDFQILTSPVTDLFVKANSSLNITVEHLGNADGVIAPLAITYNDTETLLINLRVQNIPDGDAVVSYTLINATTDADLFDLSDGQIIDINTVNTAALNIRANTNPPTVGSVVLELTGPVNVLRVESVAPYALFGDKSGDYNLGSLPQGIYTLTATPFSTSGGGGTAGNILTINFEIGDPPTSSGQTYYVSPSGDDNNSGLDPQNAWQSIAKVNSFDFQSGDKLLFESGQAFIGGMVFDENDGNDPELPLVISVYNGSSKAIINSGNENGILVTNRAAMNISDLNIQGSGSTQNSSYGIAFLNQLSGNQKQTGIVLSNLTVGGYGESGVIFAGLNDTSGFADVLVENIVVSDCLDRGITTVGFFDQTKTGYSHSNIIVNSCEVFNITGYDKGEHSGNGILLSDVQGSSISNSVVYNCGTGNTNCGGPFGIWYFDADQVVIEYNEVYGMSAGSGCDGGGFDLDGGVTNGTIQYNYSHDNEGPGYLVGQFFDARPMDNITVRYNISENDAGSNLGAITLFNDNPVNLPEDIKVYNNTIYIGNNSGNNDRAAVLAVDSGNPFGNNIDFYNNIFSVSGEEDILSIPAGFNVGFFGNLYHSTGLFNINYQGNSYSNLEGFRNSGNEVLNTVNVGVEADPLLINPGAGVIVGPDTPLSTLTGYQVNVASPAIESGIDLVADIGSIIDIGNLDFYGNATLTGSTQDIGIYEYEQVLTGPIAIAQANITSGEVPLEVLFNGSGSTEGDSPIVSYSWNFGDGNGSNLADPAHEYITTGIFTAVLTVVDEQGLESTDEIEITVNSVLPEGDAVISFTLINAETDTDLIELTDGLIVDAAQVNGLGINIRANTNPSVVGSVVMQLSGPLSNSKTESVAPYALFGDVSGNYKPQILPEGDYVLTATPYSSGGGGGISGTSLSVNFTIGEPATTTGPTAVAVADVDSGDTPLTVNFTGSSSVPGDNPITAFFWDFGDGNSSNEPDPEYTYTAAGNYLVTLTVTDSEGIQSNDQVNVTVTDPVILGPTAIAVSDVQTGDVPLTVNFTGSGSIAGDNPIAGYSWDFGDGTTANNADPIHQYTAAGSYTAELTVTDDLGLSDTDQISITVTEPVQGDAVVSFTLINADTDTDLFELAEGTTIDLVSLGNIGLNVRANTNPSVVGSVLLQLEGPVDNTRTESVAPYALFGDSSGNYFNGALASGNYTLTATPYTASGGGGIAGTSLVINFSVVNTQTKSGTTSTDSALSDETIMSEGVLLYPNPANYTLNISGLPLTDISPEARFYMHDIKGALLKTFTPNGVESADGYALPVDDLQQGVYLLSFKNNDRVVLRKRFVVMKQ